MGDQGLDSWGSTAKQDEGFNSVFGELLSSYRCCNVSVRLTASCMLTHLHQLVERLACTRQRAPFPR